MKWQARSSYALPAGPLQEGPADTRQQQQTHKYLPTSLVNIEPIVHCDRGVPPQNLNKYVTPEVLTDPFSPLYPSIP